MVRPRVAHRDTVRYRCSPLASHHYIPLILPLSVTRRHARARHHPAAHRPRFRRRSTEARPRKLAVAQSTHCVSDFIEKGKGHAVHLCCPSRGSGVCGDRRLRRRRARRSRARASPVRSCTRTWRSISCTAPAPAARCRSRCRRRWPRAACRWSRPAASTSCRSRTPAARQVFIQAGDIVKGGKQDRVLTVSFLLPPNSGRVPIASFCVEQGRWSARGKEDHARFSSAQGGDALARGAARHGGTAARAEPERARAGRGCADATRHRLRPALARAERDRRASSARCGTRSPPRRRSCRAALNAPVASPQSASSLQLSLENEKLKEARAAYIKALQAGRREGRRRRRLRRRHQRQA